jgi:phasin family protein
MSNLPEQFSQVRQSQIDAQLNFFRTFTGKAFDSAEKIIALNFDASRASLEKSSALVRQIISAKDPRDLFALTSQTQSQFDSMLAYSRRLFGIASAAAVAPTVPAVESAAMALAGPALTRASETPAPVVMPAPELVAVTVQAAAPTTIAEPNSVAKAVGNPDALPKPSAASFPVPSSSKPIAVASVKPVEAAPPPAPVSGTPEVVTKHAAPASVPAKPPRKK